jgi:hypothetical protein
MLSSPVWLPNLLARRPGLAPRALWLATEVLYLIPIPCTLVLQALVHGRYWRRFSGIVEVPLQLVEEVLLM